MTVRARRIGAVLLVATLALVGACRDDEPEEVDGATGDDPTTEPAETGDGTDEPTAAGARLPAGTELADGLVVPEGAGLAGTVFPDPGTPGVAGAAPATPDGWIALLPIDEGEVDPFAVFDALAADVRETGPAMPGSADSCSWQLPAVDEASGPGRLVAVAGPAPPAEEIVALACEATASDGDVEVTMRLDWGDDHPGTILVTRGFGARPFAIGSRGEPYGTEDPAPEAPEAVVPDGSCAAAGCEDDDPTPTTRQPPDTLPPTGPDPVPAEAVDLLPERPAAEDPAVGEPFGGESGCFAATRAVFHLPEGARLAGTDGGYDATSVLAVDDADAAMEALFAEAGETEGMAPVEILDAPLDDGTAIRTMSFQGGAGGTCWLQGSTDGHHLLIQMGP
ncbi:MAG TPA: hypothetical protein VF228_23195, partial [Iamia sp.]